MNELEQLEKDLELVGATGGRPELLRKLAAQIAKLRDQDINTTTEITAVPETQLDELFRSADHEIQALHVEGTDEYISRHHPDLNLQIADATNKIHEIWKQGRKGEARIDEFVAALGEWKSLHIKAIELFKAEENRPF